MNKILIIEDDQSISQKLVQQINTQFSAEIFLAESLTQAQGICEATPDITIALVDIDLPDASDEQAVHYTLGLNIPTIALIDSIDDRRKETLLLTGIVDYFIKQSPFSYQSIVELIERLEKNRSTKVLLLEDSVTMREHIGNLLRRHQFDLLEAKDGAEAAKMLLEQPDIALVLLDYKSSSGDGFELIHNIRNHYARPDVMIIGLSAEGDKYSSAKLLKAGANDFLTKPFVPEEFYCRVYRSIVSLDLLECRSHIEP